ncbi:MAG: 50S ribosomal protein L21, partial [Terrimicrobiaceae bacterium]|nr:50S ribosomal protein L21 [Terrimicrobiaceae bacterium]
GGKQYRVATGDIIEVEKLDLEEGAAATFDQVLLVSDGSNTRVGTPCVKGASVAAEVVAQAKGPKLISYKYKRRKGYHRTVGHRRRITQLKITAING